MSQLEFGFTAVQSVLFGDFDRSPFSDGVDHDGCLQQSANYERYNISQDVATAVFENECYSSPSAYFSLFPKTDFELTKPSERADKRRRRRIERRRHEIDWK
jgi:hypothetical protein